MNLTNGILELYLLDSESDSIEKKKWEVNLSKPLTASFYVYAEKSRVTYPDSGNVKKVMAERSVELVINALEDIAIRFDVEIDGFAGCASSVNYYTPDLYISYEGYLYLSEVKSSRVKVSSAYSRLLKAASSFGVYPSKGKYGAVRVNGNHTRSEPLTIQVYLKK
jgi:hypothetical protein